MNAAKCFFIDDDEDDRSFFCDALAEINPNITCMFAKDGCEALKMLNNTDSPLPDVIFMDMNMPFMDGNECLNIIKSNDRLKDIRVFIYSTSASKTAIEEVLAAGAEQFLIKPSSMANLKSMLKQIIMPNLDDVVQC